jgi:hypothetical protein
MSWFLVHVARHSIILTIVGWNPIHAVRIHIWAGYVAMIGAFVHSILWIIIWFQDGKIAFAAC